MKKNIILSTLLASSLFAVNASASSIEDRIANLEAQIKALKDAPDDIEDLDERLSTVETRSYTDKIQLGLGMRVEVNNYTNTYANGTDYDANNIWRTKLNINMKSKIADNLKFTGRLSMYKNWGDSTARNTNYDSMQGRKPDSSTLYVERAYLDWTMNPGSKVPVIMTLGRQPSSDGPSYQIKEDTTRKGTYDALAFDGAADGIVFTANLNNISKGTSVRVAYGTPNVLDNQSNTPNQMSYSGANNANFENTTVTGFFIDQTLSSLKFGNLIQAYYVSAKDMNANPAMGANDVNVGDLTITGLMFEASKINGNLDFFAHFAKNEAKPNSKFMPYDMNGDGNVDSAEGIGLLSTNGMGYSTKTGHAYWLGARYTINKNYKVGAEYNKGSQNWFSFTSGANDPLNKLATRGDAVEIYLTRKVNKNANIRIGYVDINYDYTGSGNHLSAPMAINSNFGTNAVKETKNTYITFNVLF